jgi:cobaltochelatase CobT
VAREAQRQRGAYAQQLGATTVAVYRAVATRPGHGLAGNPAEADKAGWQMLLSEVPRQSAPAALARWRGRVDALAVRARYSNVRRYNLHRPSSKNAQWLFSLLEQNRVETLAARAFLGVRDNLQELAQERWIRARPEGVVRAADETWLETFALLCRVPLDAPLPPAARAALAGTWRSWISPAEAREVEALAALVEDQDAYARQALRVIAAVLGVAPDSGLRPDKEGTEQPDVPGRAAPHSVTSAKVRSDDSAASGDPMARMELRDTLPSPQRAAARTHSLYRAYTTAFDQVVLPGDLCDLTTLEQRRRELDQRVSPLLMNVMRGAHRLQRRLLALQARSWQFDLEEGLLDANRLTRVATNPLEPLAYKDEAESAFPDTVVTLLVDNSGSMRGLPIATAAVCAELLGRMLERCGVKTEILGFTTGGWRGGRARAQWLAAGRPPDPGRLTELRHIIYKTADEPWRRARPGLGLMLDGDLLKENVDGEALLWAHDRLMRRIEPRRILLVISDGAPLDEATIDANDPGYLERHLHRIIDWIERESPIEIAAIGIGHDVTNYYRHAMRLGGVEELGEAIVEQLITLFDAPLLSSAARRVRTPARHLNQGAT